MARKRYYGSIKERPERKMERKDSSIISEDKSKWANLPQDVIHKDWPKAPYGADYELDDTISGVNSQISDDVSQMRKQKSKSKY